jgi:hypothetical protein
LRRLGAWTQRRYGRGGDEKIPAFMGIEPCFSAYSQSLDCPSYNESYSVKFNESNIENFAVFLRSVS